jgi:hypothetical protein
LFLLSFNNPSDSKNPWIIPYEYVNSSEIPKPLKRFKSRNDPSLITITELLTKLLIEGDNKHTVEIIEPTEARMSKIVIKLSKVILCFKNIVTSVSARKNSSIINTNPVYR